MWLTAKYEIQFFTLYEVTFGFALKNVLFFSSHEPWMPQERKGPVIHWTKRALRIKPWIMQATQRWSVIIELYS